MADFERAARVVDEAARRHGIARTIPLHALVETHGALQHAAGRAAREFGYTRMWSIHPDQVEAIVEAFAPTAAEIDLALEIIGAAQRAGWAPIRHRDTLHDRASYRYFWQVLERAQRTQQLPAEARQHYFSP